MKQRFNYKKYWVIFLGIVFISQIIPTTTTAQTQSCNQVEILYEQPDCYKSKGSNPATGGQDRTCIPVTVCVNQKYNYTAAGTWSTYLWSVTSGPATPAINPAANVFNVNISWPVVGVYVLTLTVTDGLGNTFTRCLEVTVKDKPVANFTFAPNNACAGSTVNFTNSTVFSGTPSYSWNFGDPLSGINNTDINKDPTHVFNTTGSYTVTLITYSTQVITNPGTGQNGDSISLVTCCADTITKIVDVVAGNVKIECISTVCAGDTATYTAVGCASPTWGTPVGGTVISTSGNTIKIKWGNGNPQGQLSVSCGGCTAYVTIPIVPSSPIITGNTSPCNSSPSSYTVPFLPGTFYTWTLTDLTTSTNANSLLNTYPDNNTVFINWASASAGHTYQLKIFLDNKHLCCQSTGTLTITPKPKFVVNGPIIPLCLGGPGYFSTSPGGTFDWAVSPITGVVLPSSTATPSYNPTFNAVGTFVVTATNTSGTFCNTSASATVVVPPLPTPGTIVGTLNACAGNIYPYNSSTPAPTGWYYKWTITNGTIQPGGGTTATGDNINVQWAILSGTVQMQLIQTIQPSNCLPASTITVTAATPGIITGPISACVDDTKTYTVSGGTLPPGTTITWNITPASLGTIISGQGTNSITVLWHGLTGTGPWGPASVNATTGCGSLTSQTGIMIDPKFTITITKTGTDICQPGGVTLTANGAPAGATYAWTPGGPTIASWNITSAPPSYPFTYTILVKKGGCSYTESYIMKDPFIIVPITCGVGTCNGLNTNEVLGVQVVKPAIGPFTYQWYSGVYPSTALPVGTGTNYYTAPAPGPYWVNVMYGSCKRHLQFNVAKVCCPDVNVPSINATQITCNQYSFTGTTPNPTGATITWSFGDGTTAPGVSGVPIVHNYLHAGVYCVTFCVGPPSPNPTNCTGNCAVKTVTVPIEAAFSYQMGCNGCVKVTDLSTVIVTPPATATYLWDFGEPSSGTNTSTSQNPPLHCYATAGTYTITLTITYNSNVSPGGIICTSIFTQTVVYTPLSITLNTPVCTGLPVNFSSSPGGFLTYTWAFGDGNTAYTASTTHIYNIPNPSYNVTLSVTDDLGNTCTATKPVTVFPGFTNCKIAPKYICPGQSATLTGPPGASTYLWEVETSPGTWIPAPGLNTTINYTTAIPGFYHVIVTNANGCTCTSNRVEVKLVPKPKASFTISPSKNLCAPGGSVTLTAPMIPGYTYQWIINGTSFGPASPSFIYNGYVALTTVFDLIMINQYGCRDTCTQTVTVNPLPAAPVISSNPGGTLCEGVPITLTVTNYATNITWNTGATTTSITVSTAGTYIATYTNPLTGCSASTKIVVNRRPSAGLFPHFCDSIPCNCTRPFVIYAPKPLIGAFASTYSIDWYNANTNAFIINGPSYNNGGAGAQTGSYYVIITDQLTGCKDTSNNYSIVVPPCDTCSCKDSHWGEIQLTEGGQQKAPAKNNVKANVPPAGGTPIILKCNSGQTLECNKTYSINASYICKDTACNGKVTYSLQTGAGSPITGSAPLTFTTPNINSTYILTLYGWCGGKICDSCVIDLIIKCDPKDCCKNSYWKEEPYYYIGAAGTAKPKKIDCTKETVVLITGDDCKKPLVIGAAIQCPPDCKGTDSVFVYDGAGALVKKDAAPLTLTGLANGNYTVVINGYCGGKLCLTCKLFIKVDCNCECNPQEQLNIQLSKNDKIQQVKCGADLGKLNCKDNIVLDGSYACNPKDCPANLSYVLTGGGGGSGMLPLTLSSLTPGSYSILIQAYCGGKLCKECRLTFTVECDKPCCPYTITATHGETTYAPNANATIVTNSFTITGIPATANITEVRANVISYTIDDNYKGDCMKCVNLPFTWASASSATNIATAPPKITMFGGITVPSFNGSGAGAYQNPREFIWNNGSNLNVPITTIGMSFILPLTPAIDCCELKGKICVKFTFRDEKCNECEAIGCFDFVIKKK